MPPSPLATAAEGVPRPDSFNFSGVKEGASFQLSLISERGFADISDFVELNRLPKIIHKSHSKQIFNMSKNQNQLDAPVETSKFDRATNMFCFYGECKSGFREYTVRVY